MSRAKKAIIAAAVAIAVAGAAVWYFVQQSALLKEAAKIAENVDVDVSMQGLTLTQGEEGAMRWKLVAESATYLQEQGRIRVDGPLITYYRQDSGEEIEVRAPQGEVDQNTEEAWLWPDVEMRSGQSTVTAEKLHYAGSGRTITLTGGVVLKRPDMRVDAENAVVELESNSITATGRVKAVLRRDMALAGQKEQ